MATLLFCLIAIILSTSTEFIDAHLYNLTNWTLSNQMFSQDTQDSIVVFDNITRNIWILGGQWQSDRIYSYNIDNDILTDVTSIYNPSQNIDFEYSYFHNSNAVIINRTIYYSNDDIRSFNIDTLQYINALIPFIDTHMCLVTDTNKTKLYFAAGTYLQRFRIYDLLTQQVDIGPDLNQNHKGGACHVFNNVLYVLGGDASTTIEYIDLTVVNDNIMNAEWNTLQLQLPTNLYAFASAVYEHLILIIGGYITSKDPSVTDNTYIFDTNTNVLYNGHRMALPVAWIPAVCVESRVYLFAGYIDGSAADTIWFADVYMLTDEPTTALPSTYPTIVPSSEPTSNPSSTPISNPTFTPSDPPTSTSILFTVSTVSTVSRTYIPTEYPSKAFAKTTNFGLHQTESSMSTDIDYIATTDDANWIQIVLLSLFGVVGCLCCFVLCCVVSEWRFILENIRKRFDKHEHVMDVSHDEDRGQGNNIDNMHTKHLREMVDITPGGDVTVDDNNAQQLQVTSEGDPRDYNKPNVCRYSDSESHDSSDHNNDDLWAQPQEGVEEVQDTTNCTTKE